MVGIGSGRPSSVHHTSGPGVGSLLTSVGFGPDAIVSNDSMLGSCELASHSCPV